MQECNWETEPYQYAFLSNVFSKELYRDFLDNLPPDGAYKQYSSKYPNRYIFSGKQDPFWFSVFEQINEKGKARSQLCRDFPGYSIGPHTDGRKEHITALLYLTDREVPYAGTSLYVHKDPEFTSDGTQHLEFQDFRRFASAPYAPNCGFVFKRSDRSFHGVEPVDVIRNVLQISIYAGH